MQQNAPLVDGEAGDTGDGIDDDRVGEDIETVEWDDDNSIPFAMMGEALDDTSFVFIAAINVDVAAVAVASTSSSVPSPPL